MTCARFATPDLVGKVRGAPRRKLPSPELGAGGKPSKTVTWVDWTGTAGVPITDIWPDHTRAIISIAGGGTSFRTAIDLHPGKPEVPK